MTDEMKKYNEFYIVYLDDSFNAETPIKLTMNGDYLEGELDHLSNYALVGNVVEVINDTINNPKTGDNIYAYFLLLGLTGIGLLVNRKKRFN